MNPRRVSISAISLGLLIILLFVVPSFVFAQQDFTLTPSANSVSVQQGSQNSITFTTTVSGGFNSTIGLSQTGAPAGVTIKFDQIPAPGSGTSMMAIAVDSSAQLPPAPVQVTVFADGAGVHHQTMITLSITAAPASFTISPTPKSRDIAQGDNGSLTILATPTGDFTGDVSLSNDKPPSGITITFEPQSVHIEPGKPAPSQMTIAVDNSATVAGSQITVTGSNGGTSQKTTVGLNVTAGALSTSSGGCAGCILSIGIGANINNKHNSDYVNSANILQTTHLGNSSPQFLVGVAYQLPWRSLPAIRRWADCDTQLSLPGNQDKAEADLQGKLVYCYPWRVFVNAKFTPDASSTFSGFTFGLPSSANAYRSAHRNFLRAI